MSIRPRRTRKRPLRNVTRLEQRKAYQCRSLRHWSSVEDGGSGKEDGDDEEEGKENDVDMATVQWSGKEAARRKEGIRCLGRRVIDVSLDEWVDG